MSPDSFDALITDRELGELPVETAELLEAYLASHPRAKAQEATTVATLVRARQAVAIPREIPCREPIVNRLRREQVRLRNRRHLVAAMRMAAGIAVGVGIGWLWFAQSTTMDRGPVHMTAREVSTAANRASTFWGLENFTVNPREIVSAAATSSGRDPRLRWTSPVRKPRWEENP